MTISELADEAGVTERTIRYYVEQGVLPPPERGRPAAYTDEHVRRLALVRRLKEQYLPLEEIRDMMQRLSLAQVEDLLAQHPATPAAAKRETLEPAADYIAGVLRQATAREQMKKAAAPPPPPPYVPGTPPTYPPGSPPLPGYPAPPPPGRPPVPYLPGSPAPSGPGPGSPPPVVPAPLYPAPVAPPPDAPAPADPTPARRVTPLVPEPPHWLPPAGEHARPVPSDTWQRISLAPGIELHYTVSDDARFNKIVERLVEAAVHLLEALPEKAVEES
jgi:DNA-binding transcriptional MerR regulator